MLVGVAPPAPADVVRVARDGAPVRLTPEAVEAIERSRAVVDALAAGPVPTYGVSTGFGALATRHIPPSSARSCSARWSARTPPAPGQRSSARSPAR